MIYMYGGPIGRDKITKKIVYIKSTIYVKGFDRLYLCIAYPIDNLFESVFGDQTSCMQMNGMQEARIGHLEYELVGTNEKGISKYRLANRTNP